MKIKKLFNTNDELIEGPLLIEPEIFYDERGYFLRFGIKKI